MRLAVWSLELVSLEWVTLAVLQTLVLAVPSMDTAAPLLVTAVPDANLLLA